MIFTRLCYKFIIFETSKHIANGWFKKFNSFSKILPANVGVVSPA